jgi:hypothetical protein
MPLIRRLLNLWALGKTVSNTTPMFMRLLLGMAAITLLTVVTAILVSLLILGILWLSYEQLTAQGMEPQEVLLLLGGIITAFIVGAILWARSYLRRIRKLSRHLFLVRQPFSNGISNIAHAFIDGLLTPAEPRKR